MEFDKSLLKETNKRLIIRFPMFAEEFAKTKIEFCDETLINTAGTDGDKIFVNYEFFNSLNSEDRLFLIAHEFLHIKFEHMFRLKDSKGNLRDPKTWNIATDAIINANLKRDGFKIIEGGVDIPNAINFTAEELYKVLQKKEQEEKQKLNKNQKIEGLGESLNTKQSGEDIFGEITIKNHSLWGKAFEKSEGDDNMNEKNRNLSEKLNKNDNNSTIDERKSLNENRELRKRTAIDTISKIASKGLNKAKLESLGVLERVKPVADWRIILKREMEKDEVVWSQRKSIAENNYAYRLEDYEDEDSLSEIMIDTSGSVSGSLIRSFLRQLKPLLNTSKIKVACFDTRFHGFTEIKTEKDIEKFEIVGRGGTDFNEAVQHFSDKREINKIVFTDGEDTMSLTDKKYANIIWVVFDNKKFKPAVGRLLQVSSQDIEKKKNNENDYEF